MLQNDRVPRAAPVTGHPVLGAAMDDRIVGNRIGGAYEARQHRAGQRRSVGAGLNPLLVKAPFSMYGSMMTNKEVLLDVAWSTPGGKLFQAVW